MGQRGAGESDNGGWAKPVAPWVCVGVRLGSVYVCVRVSLHLSVSVRLCPSLCGRVCGGVGAGGVPGGLAREASSNSLRQQVL